MRASWKICPRSITYESKLEDLSKVQSARQVTRKKGSIILEEELGHLFRACRGQRGQSQEICLEYAEGSEV
jgi:hypothetical protein